MEKSAKVSRKTPARDSGRKAGAPGLDSDTGEVRESSLLPRAFLESAPTEQVAPRLLGRILAHRTRVGVLAGRIVEVEAYLGPHNDPPDPAAHTYRGPTPRNCVIFGPAGHAYVYAIYGRYFCMNITCEPEGIAGCVLVRALEPLAAPGSGEFAAMARNRGLQPDAKPSQLTSGPSRLCQALGLTRPAHNGLDLLGPNSPLQLRDDGYIVSEVLVTARIGIKRAVDWPLRFALPGNKCVSGPTRLTGNRVLLL
jgi:DNA-3-methyladenine glycosylase